MFQSAPARSKPELWEFHCDWLSGGVVTVILMWIVRRYRDDERLAMAMLNRYKGTPDAIRHRLQLREFSADVAGLNRLLEDTFWLRFEIRFTGETWELVCPDYLKHGLQPVGPLPPHIIRFINETQSQCCD